MTWGFRAQRRADEFDALVEGLSTTGPATDPATGPATRDADLLELVGALRSTPAVTARPEFVADLRAQLMVAAETALVPDDLSRLTLPPRRSRRERRLAALVGGIAIVGASTSVAMASQSALPGESLYPIKRALESAHTGLSVGDGDKGRTELSRASTRLDELTSLTSRTPADDVRIAHTLTAFTNQATHGADLLVADYSHHGTTSSITRLRDFAATSIDRLHAVEPAVPYDARDELLSAASVLAQIDAEAAQRCPTCDTAPVTTLPPGLAVSEIVIPTPPTASDVPTSRPSSSPGGKLGSGATPTPDLPQVGADVGPGSVQAPSAGATSGPATDPLKSLTDSLTHGLGGAGSSTSGGASAVPSVPSVGDVVHGVNEILQGVLDPIIGGLPTAPPTK